MTAARRPAAQQGPLPTSTATQPRSTLSSLPDNPNWTLFVLTVVGAVCIVDRQILSLLVVPIKAELKLTNLDVGLLTGASFGIFYITLGVPLAWLADRSNRVWLLSACLAVWSLATATCGAATSFAQLFMARVAVGAGEAGNAPASLSLISDVFPARRRATALAVYGWVGPLGTIFGVGLGGWLADTFGWRLAFVIVAAPGLVLAGLAPFLTRDPKRRAGVVSTRGSGGAREVLQALRHKASLRHVILGAALFGFVTAGMFPFIVLFLHEVHGLSLTQIGAQLGVFFGLGGMLGSWLSGVAADRLRVRSAAGYPMVTALAFLAGAPFLIAAVWVRSAELSVVCFAVEVFLGGAYAGPTFASVHSLVPPHARALATSAVLLVASIFAFIGGPTFFGWLTDALSAANFNAGGAATDFNAACIGHGLLRRSAMCLTADHAARRWALAAGSGVLAWSAIHYALAARTIARETVS